MTPTVELTAEERELLTEAAAAVVRRRLAVPAMMFLETMSPMNTVTSSMLYVLSPIWRAALPASRIDKLAAVLERRETIPELIRIIDEQEDERREAERAERRQRRAGRRRWFRRGGEADETPVESTDERRGA